MYPSFNYCFILFIQILIIVMQYLKLCDITIIIAQSISRFIRIINNQTDGLVLESVFHCKCDLHERREAVQERLLHFYRPHAEEHKCGARCTQSKKKKKNKREEDEEEGRKEKLGMIFFWVLEMRASEGVKLTCRVMAYILKFKEQLVQANKMRFCAFTGFITFRLEATERPARACLARCVMQYSPHRLYSTGTFVIEERNRIYRESTQPTFVCRSLIFPIFQSTRRIPATFFVHKN